MNAILESSITVRTLRRLVRGSLIASAIRWIARLFARVDDAFARAAAEKEKRHDPQRFAAIVRESVIFRAGDALFRAPFAAWEHARIRPFVDEVRSGFVAMPPAGRIHLIGWMIAVALLTRAALYVVTGGALTAATLAVWGVVLTVAVVMTIGSTHVAAAWNDWKRRRGNNDG